MRKLSIFIDESGDFGEYNKVTEFYIVSFILHDRADSLTPYVNRLNEELAKTVYDKGAIHCEPLIRREGAYEDFLPNDRREVLRKLFYFFKM